MAKQNPPGLKMKMGEAVTPPRRPLVDQFVGLTPPTITMQAKGLSTRGGRPRTYTKPEVKRAMEMYYLALKPYAPPTIAKNEKLVARIEFYWPPPKIMAKKMELTDVVLKPTRPDADNVAKLFLDAVGELFFDDDSRIVLLAIQKAWCRTHGVYFGLWKVI